MLNMVRSFWGFFLTLLEKHTPLRVSKNSVEGIFNYHRLSDQLITSGQPTELQFQRLREAGVDVDVDVDVVVNLLPYRSILNTVG